MYLDWVKIEEASWGKNPTNYVLKRISENIVLELLYTAVRKWVSRRNTNTTCLTPTIFEAINNIPVSVYSLFEAKQLLYAQNSGVLSEC